MRADCYNAGTYFPEPESLGMVFEAIKEGAATDRDRARLDVCGVVVERQWGMGVADWGLVDCVSIVLLPGSW